MKKIVIIISVLIFGLVLLNSCDGQTAQAASKTSIPIKSKTENITKADSIKNVQTKQELLYKNLENTSAELKKQHHKLDSLMRKK